MRFLCREAGAGGEPVLLLHGFPQTSRMWTGLIQELAATGFHCVAPDQRGYSPGARPPAIEDYRCEHLASDVHEIARAAGFDRFHLVAHDWGAGAAWAALSVDAEPVASFVTLSIPHFQAFAEAIWSDPGEELYRGFLELFNAPDGAAEAIMSADDHALLTTAWSSSSPEEVADYLEVFRQPGAMTGALNWYRASPASRRALEDTDFTFEAVATPTVLIWGRDDPYVRPRSLELAAQYMTGAYRVIELDAGHWLVQEQPDVIAREVGTHIRQHRL